MKVRISAISLLPWILTLVAGFALVLPPLSGQSPRALSGGAFLPTADYNISGRWDFTATPTVNGTALLLPSSGVVGSTALNLTYLAADGTCASAPSFAFASDPTLGFCRPASGFVQMVSGGNGPLFGPTRIVLGSAGFSGWSSLTNPSGGGLDTTLRRTAAAELSLGTGSLDNQGVLQLKTVTRNSASGGQSAVGVSTELLTIAAAATTDTTANLLPANAYIESVVVNVVTAIPTAATFLVGDATITNRFATGIAVAQGTQAVGLTHVDLTGTSGPRQTAAAKIRITPNATPGAATGVVRIDVYWRTFAAGTT